MQSAGIGKRNAQIIQEKATPQNFTKMIKLPVAQPNQTKLAPLGNLGDNSSANLKKKLVVTILQRILVKSALNLKEEAL